MHLWISAIVVTSAARAVALRIRLRGPGKPVYANNGLAATNCRKRRRENINLRSASILLPAVVGMI
jgi:hypothetical protein